MAQTIQIKRSTGSSAPTSLANGELAYLNHSSSKKLYIGRPGGGSGDIDVIGGKDFTDKLDGIDDNANNYVLPVATNSALGGIKIGYSENGKNYPVELDSQKAYVNVPWTDTVYTLPTASSTTLGGIKIGTGLTIDGNGVVTADEVTTSAVSSAGALMKTGGTMTGNLKFGDAKSIFLGASDDFQLVHSATGGSFIVDQGPGALKLVTNGTGVQINGGGSTGGSSSTVLAEFHSDSTASSGDQYYVELNYGTSSTQKFRTAAGGVEITGNIVVSGNVDGRDVAADGTKLDTVEENADVTPSWVPSSNPNYLTSETFASSDAGNFTFSGDTMSTSGATMTLDPSTTGVGGTVVVEGSLTVKGTTTTVNSTSVNLEDNIIVLNKGEASTPSADAGLEVERGTSVNAYLVWDESEDRWSVALGGGNGNDNEILQTTMHAINHEGAAIDGGTF